MKTGPDVADSVHPRLRCHDLGTIDDLGVTRGGQYLRHDGDDRFAVRVDDLFADHHRRLTCLVLQRRIFQVRCHRVEARCGRESGVGVEDKFTFVVSGCSVEGLFAHF